MNYFLNLNRFSDSFSRSLSEKIGAALKLARRFRYNGFRRARPGCAFAEEREMGISLPGRRPAAFSRMTTLEAFRDLN